MKKATQAKVRLGPVTANGKPSSPGNFNSRRSVDMHEGSECSVIGRYRELQDPQRFNCIRKVASGVQVYRNSIPTTSNTTGGDEVFQ